MEAISKTPSPKRSRGGSTHALALIPKPKLLGKYRDVSLVCNMFDIFKNNKNFIYQYPLKFEPPVQDDSREIIQEVLNANRRSISREIGSFIDSGICLFSFRMIEGETATFEDHEQHALVLEQATCKEVDMNHFVNYSDDDSSGSEEMIQTGVTSPSQEVIRVMNIMIKNKMRELKYKEFGLQKKYFNFNTSVLTQSGTFNIFAGYKTSIGCYEGYKLKILIDYTVKIMRRETLQDEIESKVMHYMDHGKARQEAFDIATDELVCNQYCLADYGNKRIYKLEGVAYDLTPMSQFPENDKGYETYYDYFFGSYNYKIKNRDQNLVYHIRRRRITKKGSKGPVWDEQTIYLVPEMLKATGMTDQQSKNYQIMREVAEYTKLEPKKRMDFIYKQARVMDQNPSQAIGRGRSADNTKLNRRNIDLKIDQDSNYINGIQLDYPRIQIGDNKCAQLSAKWGGNFMINGKLYQKSAIKNWAIVYQEFEVRQRGGRGRGRGRNRGGRGGGGEAFMFHERIFDEFKSISKRLGIKLEKPKTFKKGRNIKIEELKGIIDKAAKNKAQMVVFMLSDFLLNKKRYYHKLKNYALEVGVKTQMIKLDSKTITKRGFTDNLLIQIISKIGYVPWKISKYPYMNQVSNGRKGTKPRVCLVGFDVCHLKGNKSMVAMSSTTTDDFTGIYNDILIQGENYRDKFAKNKSKHNKKKIKHSSEEIINGAGLMVVQAIKAYAERNGGKKPTNVIVYRDGVGEGQIREVNIKEVNAMRKCIATNFTDCSIDLTVIIVTKRLNERFFIEDRGIVTNPVNGLVVERAVVSPDHFEWYMVAQNVTQGTATPTKFRMIYNDNDDIPADYWYNLTYYTTYLYYNWKGPIRVPMVCQNAHTLAFLASQSGVDGISDKIKHSNYHL